MNDAEISSADRLELSDRLEEIAKQSGTRVSFFQCDVADISSVERAFEDAMRKARYPLRGLLTCAGVLRTGETTTFAAADSKIQLDINTLGTFQCAQVAARYVLRDNVSASFVFIGSLSGYIANSVSCDRWRISSGSAADLASSMV